MCNEAARLRSLGEIVEAFSVLKIPLSFPDGAPNLAATDSIRITDPAAIVRLHDGAHQLVQRRWSWAAAGAAAGNAAGNAAGKGAGKGAATGAGKPVYNYRSEGRRFVNAADGSGGRCLIPLDGFYEFTDPGTIAAAELGSGDGGDVGGGDSGSGDSGGGDMGARTLTLPLQEQRAPPSPSRGEGKKTKKKDKWLFTLSPDAGAAWNPGGAARGLFAVAGLWRAGVDIGAAAGGSAAGRMTGEAFTMLTCAPGPDVAPYHQRQIVLMPRDRWADWLGGTVPAADLIAPTPGGTLVVARAG